MLIYHIWFFLAAIVFASFNVFVLKLAGEIIGKSKNFNKKLFVITIFNIFVLIAFRYLFIVTQSIYPLILLIMIIELAILSKAEFSKLLFVGSVLTYHLSAVHLTTILGLSLLSNTAPLASIADTAFFYKSIFVSYAILLVTFLAFRLLYHTKYIIECTKSKIYSNIISLTALIFILHLSVDSTILITNELTSGFFLLSIMSILFSTLFFYFLFIFTLNLIKLNVYKRKNDDSIAFPGVELTKGTLSVEDLYLDVNTGLFNENFIHCKLSELCNDKDKAFGVVWVDLSTLNHIKSSFGDSSAERYIKRIATALKMSVREYDFPSKICDDKYLVIIDQISKEDLERVILRINHHIGLQNLHEDFTMSANINKLFVDISFPARSVRDILSTFNQNEDTQILCNKLEMI